MSHPESLSHFNFQSFLVQKRKLTISLRDRVKFYWILTALCRQVLKQKAKVEVSIQTHSHLKSAPFFIILILYSITGVSQTVPASNNYQHTNLYVFSGSDWCLPCVKLERDVLSDTAFINALNKCTVEIEIIDFPQRSKLADETRKYNESIADKFEFDGVFPTMIIFSPFSKKHKRILYHDETPKEFVAKIITQIELLNE